MKLIIDISKDRYDEIMSMDWKNCRRFFDEEIRAIHDGKALEQEPCEDCISRQAVLDLPRIKTHNVWGNVIYESVDVENVRQLPSVSAQQKMGRWEWNQYDANPKIGNFHCSLCRSIGRPYFDYCPYCGAKMSEIPTGAEGSDKE